MRSERERIADLEEKVGRLEMESKALAAAPVVAIAVVLEQLVGQRYITSALRDEIWKAMPTALAALFAGNPRLSGAARACIPTRRPTEFAFMPKFRTREQREILGVRSPKSEDDL